MVSNVQPGMEELIGFVDRSDQLLLDTDALLTWNEVTLKEVRMNRQKFITTYSDSVTVVRQDDKSRSESLARARNLACQNKKWNFLDFNSEHFAAYALTGISESDQLVNIKAYIDKLISITCWATLSTGHCNNRITQMDFLNMLRLIIISMEEVPSKAGNAGSNYIGFVIEGAFQTSRIKTAYEQMIEDEISEEQFWSEVARSVGGFCGRVVGHYTGAKIGTAVCPVLGTYVGSFLGGSVGSFVGSRAGETVISYYIWRRNNFGGT